MDPMLKLVESYFIPLPLYKSWKIYSRNNDSNNI